MPSSGGKEKKMGQAEAITQAEAQNIICPSLTQEHVALHGLFRDCTLYPPEDMVHQDASERFSASRSLTATAHFVLSFCWALDGPEILGLPGPVGTLPSFLHLQWEKTRLKQREMRTKKGAWATDSVAPACHNSLRYLCLFNSQEPISVSFAWASLS